MPRLRRPGTPPARPARPLFSEGRTFAPLARALFPHWRVVAPDQRGHGFSGRGPDFSREGCIADATALLTHLGLERPVVLGHSLGGVNAYQLAARHPGLVSALVIEDIGTEIDDDLSLPHRAPTRTALTEQLGDSARYPLLIHGTRSDTVTEAHAEELPSRRPHTSLAQLPTGHTVHETAPDGFAATVSAFLDTLKG
ncbi:alpha/beta fold hydrolase [Streptomyces sp. RK62]|uniref:alpha/beta fold hydrolase n=1 Tax=Streptomyces sp. RK62 TaxID=2824893 RepID=UPI0027E2FF0B|nr:alpha/beta fold hydrolase [Streptomyces sp. RK62]